MGWFLRSWSYLSNPLFIPLLVSLWFMSYASGLENPSTILKLYLITIFTVGIPLFVYGLLKISKLANSVHLSTTKERLVPLLIYGILIIVIIRTVFNDGNLQPLYYFFIGILMSTMVALILTLFRFKISLHLMSFTGAYAFLIILSVYLNLNLVWLICGLSIALGLTATSRLYMKAHEPVELIFGSLLGAAIQIMVASYYV